MENIWTSETAFYLNEQSISITSSSKLKGAGGTAALRFLVFWIIFLSASLDNLPCMSLSTLAIASLIIWQGIYEQNKQH